MTNLMQPGERCTCTPGTADNGWHEQRCDDCKQVERRVWGHVIAWSRQMAAEIREGRK